MSTRVVTTHDLASFTRHIVDARSDDRTQAPPSIVRMLFYRILSGRSPRRETIPVEELRHVLIIRPDSIGDYVVTTPLVEWLARHAPKATIDLLVQQHSLPLAIQDPRYRHVGVIDPWSSTIHQWGQVRSLTRGTTYDVVFALSVHRVTRVMLMARAVGRSVLRVGLEQPKRNETYRLFFDHMIDHVRPLRHWCDSLAQAGPQITGEEIDNDVRPWLPLECNEPLPSAEVVVNISAREDKRRWDSSSVQATLAHVWRSRPESTVAIIAGPEDAARAQQLVAQVNDPRCVLADVGLECLPALAARAHVVASPDTAMVHIASAVGTPVVGLYLEDRKVVEWGPYRVPFSALISDDPSTLDRIDPMMIAGQVLDVMANREQGA